MIKANEFRIGNWVTGGDGVWLTVDEILKNGKLFCYPNNGEVELKVEITDPKPIPLTPEILERCGFKKEKEQKFNGVIESYALKVNVKGSNENIIHFNIPGKTNIKDRESYRFGNYTVNGYWGSSNFKYLHQLQNLYQSLTGQELVIKELQTA